MRLTTRDHDRDKAGLTYVYPVVSRRAGGISVGINLNPNRACNFRCVYCQVPGLVRGAAPPIDLDRLAEELDGFLAEILERGWLERHAPEGARTIRDVAFSGDGEPTSAEELPEVVTRVGEVLAGRALLGKIPIVVITNGSLVHREHVQEALRRLASQNGVLWFKLDSATRAGQQAINDTVLGPERVRRNLEIAARALPTWIQTIAFARRGAPPSEEEQAAYVDFVAGLVRDRVPVRGILLYGLARASHQPEAAELEALPRAWMDAWAERLRRTGLDVRVF